MTHQRHTARREFTLLILALLCLAPLRAADDRTLSIESFGAKPDTGTDTTPAVQAALAEARATHATRLVFAPGRYDFWPERAPEKYYFVSNNDPGMKRIAFPLDHVESLEIDGKGARFVFHGFVNPFILDRSKNITLRNFSIDWERPFNSEAKILTTGPDGADLEFSDPFPYRVERGVLTFIDREKVPNVYPAGGLLEFDVAKRETAFQVTDQFVGPTYLADEIAPHRVHLKVKNFVGTPGNILVFADGGRRCPAITITDSAQTKLDHVAIYHAGGMGVIAQRSRDITLDHVQVTPSPGTGRVISASADATHFANCSGQVTMTDCLFENQEDDATNIHGLYAQVSRKISPTELELRLVHPQQIGFELVARGDSIELVHGSSLVTYGQAKVKSATRLNAEYTRVTLSEPAPEELKSGDVVASLGDYPDVLIRHCTLGKNRARGFLLGSRGKIVVEDCTFHTPGAAILFEGDGRFWFEQAGVRDCVIRNNTFNNCNYGTWGNAAIQVGSGIEPSDRAGSRYNQNIRIEGNTFRVFDPRILHLYSVDHLVFRDNRIVPTTDYPAINAGAKPFDITFSDHIVLEGEDEAVASLSGLKSGRSDHTP